MRCPRVTCADAPLAIRRGMAPPPPGGGIGMRARIDSGTAARLVAGADFAVGAGAVGVGPGSGRLRSTGAPPPVRLFVPRPARRGPTAAGGRIFGLGPA